MSSLSSAQDHIGISRTSYNFSKQKLVNTMVRPSKRQRREHPLTIADNESLSCTASVYGPIVTEVVSSLDKEIILDRLRKEIVVRFGLQLTVPRGQASRVVGSKLIQKTVRRDKKGWSTAKRLVRSRVKIGTNECTRALEQDALAPLFIVLARDVHPPTILSHIPLIARKRKTPIALLPGRAAADLGKVLGIKRAAIVLFRAREPGDGDDKETAELHGLIDSFVDFAKTKLEKS